MDTYLDNNFRWRKQNATYTFSSLWKGKQILKSL